MDVDEVGSSSVLQSLTPSESTEPELEKIANFITARNWIFDDLVSHSRNFKAIPRVDVSRKSHEDIVKLVQQYEKNGIPLVMSNWHRRVGWETSIFQPSWLSQREGDIDVNLRDVHNRKDTNSMKLAAYLEYALQISPHATPTETERLYAKDAPCPSGWTDWLQDNLPEYIVPFGSGDMSVHLPIEKRVETLMTYIGMGDTYTPAHKDSCASVGQNLMVYTQNDDTSSFWFMTATQDAEEASDYWKSLGQELDLESYVASIDELSKASFDVYICQQKLGDFVIVPPRSSHQVINSGGLTMKASWSRLTSQSLTLALTVELPIYQRVCRSEIYRIRATIAATARDSIERLRASVERSRESEAAQYRARLLAMLPLYRQMLVEEYGFSYHSSISEQLGEEEICDCCGADIWQSAMICGDCQPKRDTDSPSAHSWIVLCAPCYVDGRSCHCRTMKPAQVQTFATLLSLLSEARDVLKHPDGTDHNIFNSENWEFVGQLSTTSPNVLLKSRNHPPYFRLANFLRDFRLNYYKSIDSSKRLLTRTCAFKHTIPVDQSVRCNGCHNMYCWGHTLATWGIHFASIAIRLIEADDDPENKGHMFIKKASMTIPEFHSMHLAGVAPESRSKKVNLTGRWTEWLPLLAWNFVPSRPLNETITLGWYDLPLPGNDKLLKSRKPKEDPEYLEPLRPKNLKRKADPQSVTNEITRRSKRPRLALNIVEDRSSNETSDDELGDEFHQSTSPRRQSAQIQKATPRQNGTRGRGRGRGRPPKSASLSINVINQHQHKANDANGAGVTGNQNELNAFYSVMTGMAHEMAQIRAELSQIRGLLEVTATAQDPPRTEALLGQAVNLLQQLLEKQN